MHVGSSLRTLTAALPLVVACSSGNDSNGGSTGALGDQMSDLGSLGDMFVEENQATYDAIEDSAGAIGAALQNPPASAALAPKQAGCLPENLAGATLTFDVLTNTFIPSDPRGPSDAVQFRLFSDPQTEVGYVNVTCVGALTGPFTVNISVNTTDDVEVLDLMASNVNAFPPSNFSATLSGTLRTADGQEELAFGQGSSSTVYRDEFGRSAYVSFFVGATVTAAVSQSVSSGSSEEIMLSVQDVLDFSSEFICPAAFSYQAFTQGTPGNVTGGGIFCARPPLGDDFNYFVNCETGSVDSMVVSAASASCQQFVFFQDDPTQVGGAVLQDIQDGTDALLAMFNAVVSVADAGGAVALELAAAQQQF